MASPGGLSEVRGGADGAGGLGGGLMGLMGFGGLGGLCYTKARPAADDSATDRVCIKR